MHYLPEICSKKLICS